MLGSFFLVVRPWDEVHLDVLSVGSQAAIGYEEAASVFLEWLPHPSLCWYCSSWKGRVVLDNGCSHCNIRRTGL
jgi:hypothetical protein